MRPLMIAFLGAFALLGGTVASAQSPSAARAGADGGTPAPARVRTATTGPGRDQDARRSRARNGGLTVVSPVLVTRPKVTGAAVVGNTLVTTAGTWSGSPTQYSYGWQDCGQYGVICTSIAGATADSYTVKVSDVGDVIRSVVHATNTGGSSEARSLPTALVAEPVTVPAPVAAPAVTGTAVQGHTLSTTNGEWSGAPTSYSYEWQDCTAASKNCKTIPAADSSTYAVAASDVGSKVVSVVTAANAAGAATDTSDPTSTVLPLPPAATVLPAITGTAQVGDALTASAGTWTGSPSSYAYAWKDCSGGSCSSISGATSSTYTLQSSDAGDTIEVVVTATNAGGTGAATSAVTATVVASVPVNTAVPVISGVTQQGDTLTVSTGAWTGTPSSYTYAWKHCASGTCTAISGASSTSGNYTLQSGDVGDTIEVAVTATNAGGSGSPATSAATGTVLPAPPANTTLPAITGTAQVGDALTVSAGTWTGSPSSYAYAWKDCSGGSCSSISGATSSTYTLQSSDAGDTIEVVVTATNAGGTGAATSAATAAVSSSGGSGGDGIHVSGNALAAGTGTSGAPVVLHGVDQSGTEYQCTNGYGIFDNGASSVAASASDASDLSVMPSWGINSVFIGLNEDCWLGINGSGIANWSSDSGQNYINAIKAAVTAAESDGLYPVIAFYWGDPGTEIPSGSDPNGGGQPALPDADHAPLFWEEVANTFKNDPKVIFRLQEEPHPSATGASGAGANTDGNAGTSLYNWQCWAHGSVQFSTSSVASPYDTAPTPTSSNHNCDEYSTNAATLYQTVGMQSLINIIRGTGADNVIQVPMLGYANVADCNYPTQAPAACGFLDSTDGVKLSDPIASTDPAGSQLMADWDIYPDSDQACNTVTCYNDTIAPIAAVMPVDLGEIGPIGSSQTAAMTLLNWMDSQSPQGSYYAWAWDTWSDLITNYNGTPDSPWGTAYRSLLLSGA